MKLVFREIVLASDIGINGNLFGGTLMEWLDKASTFFVSEYIKSQNIVTAKFSEINFLEKVKEKELVKIYAELDKIGRSSITVNLKATKVNYKEYQEYESTIATTTAVFVHIDKNGKSKEIPTFTDEKYLKNIEYQNKKL